MTRADPRAMVESTAFPRVAFWDEVDARLTARQWSLGDLVRTTRLRVRKLQRWREGEEPQPRQVLAICVALGLKWEWLESWLRSRTAGRPEALPSAFRWCVCPYCPEFVPHLRRIPSANDRARLPRRPDGDFDRACQRHAWKAARDEHGNPRWPSVAALRRHIRSVQQKSVVKRLQEERGLPERTAKRRANFLIREVRRGNRQAQQKVNALLAWDLVRRERGPQSEPHKRARGAANWATSILLRAGIVEPKRRKSDATLGQLLLYVCRLCWLIAPEREQWHDECQDAWWGFCKGAYGHFPGEGDPPPPAVPRPPDHARGPEPDPRLVGRAFAWLLALRAFPEHYSLTSLAEAAGVSEAAVRKRVPWVTSLMPGTARFIFGPRCGPYADKLLRLPDLLQKPIADGERDDLVEHLLDHGMGTETVVRLTGAEERVQIIVAGRSVGQGEIRLASCLGVYIARLDAEGRGSSGWRRDIRRVGRELGGERVVDLTPPRLERWIESARVRGTGRNRAKAMLRVVKRACAVARAQGQLAIVPEIPVAQIIRRVYGEPPRRRREGPPRPRGRFKRFVASAGAVGGPN